MKSGEDPNLGMIKHKYPKKQGPSKQGKSKFGEKKLGDKSNFDKRKPKKKTKCQKCGYDHTDSQQCPAQGKKEQLLRKIEPIRKYKLFRKSKYKGQPKTVNQLGDYGYTSNDETNDDRCIN